MPRADSKPPRPVAGAGALHPSSLPPERGHRGSYTAQGAAKGCRTPRGVVALGILHVVAWLLLLAGSRPSWAWPSSASINIYEKISACLMRD